jgi:hypothetical protein
MRFVAAVLALELAAFAVGAAAQTGPIGRASHGTLGVGIRIASTSPSEAAYAKFQASLDTALRSSSHPRDWALAAFANPNPERTIGAGPSVDGDLYRAQQAAPGDALVQWLVANNGGMSGDAHAAAAIDALTRIEPDNAAPWMLALAAATRRGDVAGIDDALTRMAGSRRFDDHFADTVHAWISVYDRYPPPPVPVEESYGYDPGFVAAFAHAAAVAMPSYQHIVAACKPSASHEIDAVRASRCEKAGHLMLYRGTTLIARRIGFVLVRNLGVLDDADRAADRDLDWYRFNGAGEEPSIIDALAHEDDWRRLDDEIDVIKNRLRRSHLPTVAPDGWSLPDHPAAAAVR